jgi:membrane-bound inhibitor of C-type lysozyme
MSIENVIEKEIEELSEETGLKTSIIKKLYNLIYSIHEKDYNCTKIDLTIKTIDDLRESLKNYVKEE